MKNFHHLYKDQVIKYNNQQITHTIIKIQVLIDASISLLAQNKVLTRSHQYILNLNPIAANLANNIKIFKHCEHLILAEITTGNAESTTELAESLLAKIRTYIDLTRISELPSFELNTLDIFQEEAWLLFDELRKLF